MKTFSKILFSIIIYLFFLLTTLMIGSVIFSIKEKIQPSCYIKNSFQYEFRIKNYYISLPEIAYKKDNKFYIKDIRPELILTVLLVFIILISLIWILFIHKIIKNSEEEKFLLKTTNLEALATQNSMTILTENIHHELNSPLKVVERNYSKLKKLLLLKTSKDILNECYDNLEIIKKKFKEKNINQIKICNKKISTKNFFELFDITETSIEQIKSILQNMASFKQLRYSNGNKTLYDIIEGAAKILNVTIDTPFKLEIDTQLKFYVIDHTTGLKNADLINIFINHFKNSVEANTTKVEVIIDKYDLKYIYIIIKDDGNGIPKEFIKDLFTPNKSTKNDFIGLRGNGLFLNKFLLKQFGGDIKLKRSEEGKGTEFILKIPAEFKSTQ